MGTINIGVPVQAEYGGKAGGAERARDEWWGHAAENDANQSLIKGGMGYANLQASQAKDRPGAQEDAALARNVDGGAGGNQNGAISLAGNLASGNAPSQAAYQLQSGLNQATAQQQAIGQSARGAAGIATAGANQQANTANLQQNAFTQAGLLRSRDMAQGRQLYDAATEQARNQANARLGMANQMGQFNAQQNNNAALGWGNAAVGLGGVSNQLQGQDLNAHNAGMNPIEAQSEADQARKHWLAQAQKQKVANNMGED